MEHKQSNEAEKEGATHSTTTAASSENTSTMIAGNNRSSANLNCTSIDDAQSSSDSSSSSTRSPPLPCSSTDVAASTSAAAVVPFSTPLEIGSSGETSNCDSKITEESTDENDDGSSSSTDASPCECISCSDSSSIHADEPSAESIAELCYLALIHAELFFAPLVAYCTEAITYEECELVTMHQQIAKGQQLVQQLGPFSLDARRQVEHQIQGIRERIESRSAYMDRLQMEQQEDQQRLHDFDESVLLDHSQPFRSWDQLFWQILRCQRVLLTGKKLKLQWARDWLLKASDIFDELMATSEVRSLPQGLVMQFISMCASIDAFHQIPTLLHRFNLTMDDVPRCQSILFDLASGPLLHLVNYTPLLQLISVYGLDGASTNSREEHSTLGAVELARQFVRENSQPRMSSANPAASDSLNILRAIAMQPEETNLHDEGNRRKALHARFMHQFAAEWHVHSQFLLRKPKVV